MARPRRDPLVRFWEHVDVRGLDECWPWQSAHDKDGYGLFQLAEPRVMVKAHRFSYALHNIPGDPIQGTLSLLTEDHIMHSCDNPPCCNPKHLSKGTCLLNNQDKMKKGRFVPWNKGLQLACSVVFFLMACQTARGDSWLDKAKDYNCAWVNKQLEHMTAEQLERKARRWHVPEEYIDLAKACPRNLKPSTEQ